MKRTIDTKEKDGIIVCIIEPKSIIILQQNIHLFPFFRENKKKKDKDD